MYDDPYYSKSSGHKISTALNLRSIGSNAGKKTPTTDQDESKDFEIINFEEGLSIRIIDCFLSEPLRLHQDLSEKQGGLCFTLTYCLTPETFLLKSSSGKDIRTDKLWDTIFSCNRTDLKFYVLPRTAAKCISISFTKQWIEQKAVFMPSKQKDFISWLFNTQSVFYFESLNEIEKEMIVDLFRINKTDNLVLFLKSRIVTLIDEFVKKSSQRETLRSPLHNSRYELIIRQVAAELAENLFNNLPSSGELSRKFAISESVLKRNFKAAYGKSMAEYYLERKMICAKKMVSECSKTISEIAYILGYEKVSNFISQFKKYNGCLPGVLQKTLLKQIA